MVDVVFSGLSDPGLLRSNNQDDYYIDPEGRFFMVADGMGGYAGGEEASRLATAAIRAYLNEHWHSETAMVVLLERALYQANEAILEDQRQHPERADMGTTIVVVTFRSRDSQPWCAHVGDSRLYRLRGDDLEQITEDHTWIAKAIRAGDVSPDHSRSHPWRHVLSQCLGRDDLDEIDIHPIHVQTWLARPSSGEDATTLPWSSSIIDGSIALPEGLSSACPHPNGGGYIRQWMKVELPWVDKDQPQARARSRPLERRMY